MHSRPRFFITGKILDVGEKYPLSADDSNHVASVLRLGKGSAVEISDGAGRCFTAEITRMTKKAVEVLIKKPCTKGSEPPLAITLAQGLLKGRKMDLVIRQAVELGVARVVPLITARSVPALEGQRANTRTERWQKIARSAAQQSRREIIPRVEAPMRLADFCADHGSEGEIVLVFWEGKKGKGLLFEREGNSSRGVSGMTVVVGPEGGFPAEEIESLRRCHAIIAGLGPRVLRAETAAVVGLALVQALLGDLLGERS